MFQMLQNARWRPGLFWAGLALGVALRLYYGLSVPLYTTDVLRNIGYGEAFWQWGFGIYGLTAMDLSPAPAQFLWHAHHYTYPAVTLLFFAFVALIDNSIFWAKLVLTAIDGINSYMIFRITQERRLGLLYWLHPIAVWYTSYEGQFEAWVVFWMLLAIHELRRQKPWAWAALGVAIQTKLFPVLLLPYFLLNLSWRNAKRLACELLCLLVSFSPSLVALAQGEYLRRYLEPGYMPDYNPLTWFIVEPQDFPEFPFWLIEGHFIAGLVFVSACAWIAARRKNYVQIFAPLAFVVLVKANIIGQFWYMTLVPAFCLTVEDPAARRVLLVCSLALGLRSLYSIFIGPIGYTNPPDAMRLLQLGFFGY